MSIARQILREMRPIFRMFEEPITRPPPSVTGFPVSVFDEPFFRTPFIRAPPIDVTEKGDKYVLEADLPGVTKENLEVRIGDAGRSVTIQGKVTARRSQPQTVEAPAAEGATAESGSTAVTQAEAGNQISAERSFVGDESFTRTVWLPRAIDGKNVSAKLEHGVLTIEVNKAEDKGSVVVPIQ